MNYNSEPSFYTNYLTLNNKLLNDNLSMNGNDSRLVSAFNKVIDEDLLFNVNSKESELTYSPMLTVIIAIVASIMSSITIIGNVFVITAFIIDKNLRKYSNYFILNLSIADLLIGILIPPYAPFLLYKRQWKIGKIACTIWLVLDYVVGSASVLCIVVISLDRYLLVSRGLKYVADQKVFKAILIMLTVWLIAFLNYAPAIIFWELISGQQTVKENECQVAFHNNLVYLTATACVEFFAPLISICGLNLAVYLNIRKRSKGLIRSEKPMFNLDKNSNKPNQMVNSKNEINTNPNVVVNNMNSGVGELTGSLSQNVKETSFKIEKLSAIESSDLTPTRHESPISLPKSSNTGKKPFSCSPSSTTCSTSSLENKPVSKAKNFSSPKSILKKTSNSNKATKTKLKTVETLDLDDDDDDEDYDDDEDDEENNKKKNGGFLLNKINSNKEKNPKKKIALTQVLQSSQNACTSILINPADSTTTTQQPKPQPHRLSTPNQNDNKSNPNSTLRPPNSSISKSKKTNNTRRTLTKDKKAARSLFILVFVFVFCWAPYTFLTLIKAVCPTCVSDNVYELAFWLLWFNSTLNPILYPFLHVKFRKAFLKILQHLFFCIKFKRKKYVSSTTMINAANKINNSKKNLKKSEKIAV